MSGGRGGGPPEGQRSGARRSGRRTPGGRGPSSSGPPFPSSTTSVSAGLSRDGGGRGPEREGLEASGVGRGGGALARTLRGPSSITTRVGPTSRRTRRAT